MTRLLPLIAIGFIAYLLLIVALPFLMAFGDTLMIEQGTWLESAAAQFTALGHATVMVREAPIKGNAVQRQGEVWKGARDPRVETGFDVP